MLKKILFVTALGCAASLPLHASRAAEPATYTIEMKNGTFAPQTLEVPAGTKIHLIVKNGEKVQTEFESYKLDQEQKIDSGASIDAYIGPLDAGEYPIFDDLNPDATGKIIAK